MSECCSVATSPSSMEAETALTYMIKALFVSNYQHNLEEMARNRTCCNLTFFVGVSVSASCSTSPNPLFPLLGTFFDMLRRTVKEHLHLDTGIVSRGSQWAVGQLFTEATPTQSRLHVHGISQKPNKCLLPLS